MSNLIEIERTMVLPMGEVTVGECLSLFSDAPADACLTITPSKTDRTVTLKIQYKEEA